MSVDEFAAALSRLVADAQDAGLTAEQLVEVLENQIETILGEDD